MSNYYQPSLYHWDASAQAAYLSITNANAANDMFISFEDQRSCQAKISYARNHGLGGVMIWQLTQDYFSGQPVGQRNPLCSAIKNGLAASSPK
jgi:chitinase